MSQDFTIPMHNVTTFGEIHVKFVRNWFQIRTKVVRIVYESHVNECVLIEKSNNIRAG